MYVVGDPTLAMRDQESFEAHVRLCRNCAAILRDTRWVSLLVRRHGIISQDTRRLCADHGACGIISEPYTDYRRIARKYKDCFIAGEGDNRVLMRNNPDEIRTMVENMVETSKMTGGYVMCVGNHIPWNVPPQAIKRYLDLSRELAVR